MLKINYLQISNVKCLNWIITGEASSSKYNEMYVRSNSLVSSGRG